MTPPHLSFVAIQAALKAGALLKKGFGTQFAIENKDGRHNLVTEYDKAAETSILATISEHFPEHAILSEECGALRTGAITWVIDPLDGTVNFAHGVPMFSVSIGVVVEKEVEVGVVYQPMTEELFIAEKGKGAYLNGQRLHVSKNKTFDQALLATGFPYNVSENPLHCIDKFAQMQEKGVPVRRLGSAAIDLAYVAAGRFDAYWEVFLHPWDMAAGKLLVEEAGGKVSHYDGSCHEIFCSSTLIASNSLLHQAMIQHLNQEALSL